MHAAVMTTQGPELSMLAKYDLMSLSRALLSKHFWLMSCAGSLNLLSLFDCAACVSDVQCHQERLSCTKALLRTLQPVAKLLQALQENAVWNAVP